MKLLWKHSIYCLLIIFLISILSVSCSSHNAVPVISGNESLPGNSKIEKINIKYAQWSISSVNVVEDLLNHFNSTNMDNINVDLVKIPVDKYIETLNMLNASGEGPDVYELINEWITSYLYKGWLADLSAYMDEEFLKPFPKWALDLANDSVYNSKFYTISSNQITYRLIYNKDLFKEAGLNPDEPPRTLGELEKYAKIISDAVKGERKYGFALPMGEAWRGLVQPMEATNAYSGVYFFNFRQGKYDLGVYKKWINTFRNLNNNGGLFPGMSSMKEDLAYIQFAEGNIGMMYASSNKISLFYDQFPAKCEWGIAMPPAIEEGSAGKGAIAISQAGLNVVSAKTKNINEAVKVWKQLYSKEYLSELYKTGSIIPVTTGVMNDPNNSQIKQNFSKFLPGKNDSIYPRTPLMMNEWLRINAYTASFLGEEQMDKALLEETNDLNSEFNIQVTSGTIDTKNYLMPDFMPANPIDR